MGAGKRFGSAPGAEDLQGEAACTPVRLCTPNSPQGASNGPAGWRVDIAQVHERVYRELLNPCYPACLSAATARDVLLMTGKTFSLRLATARPRSHFTSLTTAAASSGFAFIA
jgi:hypothetical protein